MEGGGGGSAGGICLPGGRCVCLPGGGGRAWCLPASGVSACRGGVSTQRVVGQTSQPVDRMTDTCKNITLPQLHVLHEDVNRRTIEIPQRTHRLNVSQCTLQVSIRQPGTGRERLIRTRLNRSST